jgi:uncharacterized membrane protein YhfC
MNYFLILGPIGMMIIGLSAIIVYWRNNKVKISVFLVGGLLWLISITLKSVMDLFLTPELYNALYVVNSALALTVISIIIGLRTGFFESGITYLYLKRKGKKIDWNNALALGIGFGAIEAVILGLVNTMSFIAGIMILNNPLLEATERALVEAIFNQSTIEVLFAWLERVFTIMIHVFTTTLVVKAVNHKDKNFLWLSIIFKTLVDLPIPLFQVLVEGGSLLALYSIEAYIAALGIISFYGLKWVKNKKRIRFLK